MEEALHVGVDVATPHDGFGQRYEIVVDHDHVGRLLGETASTAHGERYVGSFEGLNIVKTISDDNNFAVHLLQATSDNIFVDRVSSGNDLEVLYHLFECLQVPWLVLNIAFAIINLNVASNSLSELRRFHRLLVSFSLLRHRIQGLVNLHDASSFGEANCRQKVVSRNEANVNLRVLLFVLLANELDDLVNISA